VNIKNSSWRVRQETEPLTTGNGENGVCSGVFAHGHQGGGLPFCMACGGTGWGRFNHSLESLRGPDHIEHLETGMKTIDERLVWGVGWRHHQAAVASDRLRPFEAASGRMRPVEAGYFSSVFLAAGSLRTATVGRVFPARITCCEVPIGLEMTRLISLDHAWSGLITLKSWVFFWCPCGRPPSTRGTMVLADGHRAQGYHWSWGWKRPCFCTDLHRLRTASNGLDRVFWGLYIISGVLAHGHFCGEQHGRARTDRVAEDARGLASLRSGLGSTESRPTICWIAGARGIRFLSVFGWPSFACGELRRALCRCLRTAIIPKVSAKRCVVVAHFGAEKLLLESVGRL
jgi:hypothetical protein